MRKLTTLCLFMLGLLLANPASAVFVVVQNIPQAHPAEQSEETAEETTLALLDEGSAESETDKEEVPTLEPEEELQRWELVAGETLYDTFKRWSEDMGWHLHWKVADLEGHYVVAYDETLYAPFIGEEGIIAVMLTRYLKAPTPMRAEFWLKNNVLVITNWGI